jgi:hypothetical protein
MTPQTITYRVKEGEDVVPRIKAALESSLIVYVDSVPEQTLRNIINPHGYKVGQDCGRIYAAKMPKKRVELMRGNRVKKAS